MLVHFFKLDNYVFSHTNNVLGMVMSVQCNATVTLEGPV